MKKLFVMRKLFVIICALFSFSLYLAAETYLPFAPEGRKWVWRNAKNYCYTDSVIGDTILENGEYFAIITQYGTFSTDKMYRKVSENNEILYDIDYQLAKDGIRIPAVNIGFHEGDTIYQLEVSGFETLAFMMPTEEKIVNLHGTPRKVLKFDDYWSGVGYWIEGIGTTDRLLVQYLVALPSCDYNPYWLEACYDGDVCIYRKGDLPLDPAGIGEVDVDTNVEVRSEYFDLQGRPVNAGELAPGLYIRRTGSRAEKIFVR